VSSSSLSSSLVYLSILLLFNHEHNHALAFTQPTYLRTPCMPSSSTKTITNINLPRQLQRQFLPTASPSALQIPPINLATQLQLPLGFVQQLQVPFSKFSRRESDNLDIGNTLNRDVDIVPEAATSMVLKSIVEDLLFFLSAWVFVTPLCMMLGPRRYSGIY